MRGSLRPQYRLSAPFPEFMMGVPAGWICDTDISRNEQLKAAGNGVVPQQAAAALKDMLAAFQENR
jgi:DNA (cytosine-5)-methyltransferase 1